MNRFAWACGLVAAGLSGEAAASGYALKEQSAVGQGSAFAGATARGDDPSLLFYNPATLAMLTGRQAALVGSYIRPQAEARSGSASRAAAFGGSPITGSLGDDAAADAFVPAAYVTAQLSPEWSLGLAVTAPFGLVTKYEPDFIGRYHAQTSSLRTINIAPTIGYRPVPSLALGAALQIQQADARLSSATDFGAIGAARGLGGLGFAPGRFDGRTTIEGDNVSLGIQLGAIWEPQPGTRVGLAWRSAITQELKGDATFEGVPALLAPGFRNQRASAKVATPDIITLGLAQQVSERWTFLADFQWTNWSRFRELRIEFQNLSPPANVTDESWRDTFSVSLGAEYRWSDMLRLRAGVAYDPTPVREDTRTPRIPDSDRYWASVGASWQVLPNVELTAAYTHIFADDARVQLRAGGPTSPEFFRGNLDANYRASVDIVAVAARISF